MPSPIWPYQTTGESYLPPVIFLHGFMGSGTDWLPIAKNLATQYYGILPDLPGHGWNTDFPLTQPINFDTVADGLRQLIEYLNLAPVTLVGYSMGGRIALYTAIQFPERIASLVLEGANPGLADEEDRQARATLDDQRAEQLQAEGIDTFVDTWYAMDLFRTLHTDPARLDAMKSRRKKNDPRWAAKIIRDLSPGRQPPLWDRLHTLAMPTLLLAGALDTKYTALMNRMGQSIPRSEVTIVPNAGHNVHVEQPEAFSQLLTNFLQSK
ncbi:MAG: 2-succinyl-6-hydroxy-2,4-cyclohexadiene-1-carboxylate synthase [Anaerolineae bacterium]|nr:2-succinyl-6-hydroxy-2,4-cyclohexadiene-1-carboxylate synthase [Anaerolineae bacterium]